MRSYVGPPSFKRVSKVQRRDWQSRYSDDWKERSLEVRKAGGMRCERCGCGPTRDNPIQADHIIALSKGGSNSKINLRAYCKHCNTARKRGQTKRAKSRF